MESGGVCARACEECLAATCTRRLSVIRGAVSSGLNSSAASPRLSSLQGVPDTSRNVTVTSYDVASII